MNPIQWVWLIATAISVYLNAKRKPVQPKAATLEDLDKPTLDEGSYKGVLFGTRWVAPQELARWGLRSVAIKKKSGKK